MARVLRFIRRYFANGSSDLNQNDIFYKHLVYLSMMEHSYIRQLQSVSENLSLNISLYFKILLSRSFSKQTLFKRHLFYFLTVWAVIAVPCYLSLPCTISFQFPALDAFRSSSVLSNRLFLCLTCGLLH